jgi:hypothetical protein
MYKLVKSPISGEIKVVNKQEGNLLLSIPFDPANRDAQIFAQWLKDGGTPESAEEGGTVTSEWIAETIAKLLPNG